MRCHPMAQHTNMASSSPVSNDSVTSASGECYADRCREALASLKGPVQFTSFWLAIGLPFVHVPLLARGLGSRYVSLAFFTLLSLNVLALYVGHGYNQAT